MIVLPIVTVILFSLVIVSIAKLGSGSTDWLATLWTAPAQPARPRGVQEDDLPRFVFPNPDQAA